MALDSFVFCRFLDYAKIKQKTTHVESDPRDGSDPEAVSGSSTTEEDLGGIKVRK